MCSVIYVLAICTLANNAIECALANIENVHLNQHMVYFARRSSYDG